MTAETVTDEQIGELMDQSRYAGPDDVAYLYCRVALGTMKGEPSKGSSSLRRTAERPRPNPIPSRDGERREVMKYFLDTEFDENGKTIELISIAIVREDHATLYEISNEFDPAKCDDWVKANVLTKLQPPSTWISRAAIVAKIRAFVGDDPKPEFWGYFADYDWVVFCQLFGKMIDLPKGFPMFCMDIKQWAKQLGVDIKKAVPQPMNAHDARADALWNMAAHAHLVMAAKDAA